MASRQQIKRRIGSVRNTRQITKAMQLVAASKLRRAQEAVVGPRQYVSLAQEILARLRHMATEEAASTLFTERPVKSRLIIAISSDLGLGGAYDANIIRALITEARADQQSGVKTVVTVVGRKVAQAASRIAELKIDGVYQRMPSNLGADALRPILARAITQFEAGEVDAVDIIYTKFISTVSQQVHTRRLLPAGFENVNLHGDIAHADAEPSVGELVHAACVRLLQAQLYQAFLEAAASEQSMRMLAMKNATDNATDIIEDLTLAYNNARQAAITQELAEITGGAEALS